MAKPKHAMAAGLAVCILFGVAGLSSASVDRVRCGSTTGDFLIEVHHEWAPLGAHRFMELVNYGVFDNSPLFRVVPNFLVQWGIPAIPEVTAHWKQYPIRDDANIGIPTRRGTIGFTGGPKDSRISELWISFQDSEHLGQNDQEAPFAQIIEGMENVERWYSGYGDVAEFGGGAPDQARLYAEGAEYTRSEFPELSYITTCKHEPAPEEHQLSAEATAEHHEQVAETAAEAHEPAETKDVQKLTEAQQTASSPAEELRRPQGTAFVKCTTSTGDLDIEVRQDWSPLGALRFLELVRSGFFSDLPIFRVVPGFIAGFGIGSDPAVAQHWKEAPIPDDEHKGIPIRRGTIVFAGNGEHTRSAEFWMSYQDNEYLGHASWETAFAQVVNGMENADAWYAGYGDMREYGGNSPEHARILTEGNNYIRSEYPNLSVFASCHILEDNTMAISHEVEAPSAEKHLAAHEEAVVAQAAHVEKLQEVQPPAKDEDPVVSEGDAGTQPDGEESAWIKSKIEKAANTKLPKLVHGAEESHENMITGIIATVVLVVVIAVMSGTGNGKGKRE